MMDAVPNEGPTGLLSQDEILSRTKLIMQGLDSLKADHVQLLNASNHLNTAEQGNDNKTMLLKKSIEKIDLGLGEAQVNIALKQICIKDKIYCYYYIIYYYQYVMANQFN